MGHIVGLEIFSYEKSKEDIFNCCNNIVLDSGMDDDGLDNIKFLEDQVYEDYEAAEKVIGDKKEQNGRYDCVAVLFYAYPTLEIKYTKEHLKLEERYLKVCEKHQELEERIHYTTETVKSKTISCKHCGTRFSVENLNSNNCTHCYEDLRPQTVIDKIQKLQNQRQELFKKKEASHKKCEKDTAKRLKVKPEKYWLVQYDIHC